MSEDAPEKSRSLNKTESKFSTSHPDLSVRQLFLFYEIMNAGSQVEIADRYSDLNPSKVSRDIYNIKEKLGLTYLSDKDFWVSNEAKILQENIKPLFDVCKKFSEGDLARTVSVGAGGSILGWWVGLNSEKVRVACSKNMDLTKGNVTNVRLSCKPMTNREILSDVTSGLLDFGIVRKSLLSYARVAKSERSIVGSKDLGIVRYGLAVPIQLMDDWAALGTNWAVDETTGSLTFEESILNNGYFASVGPEGEFKEKLYRALADAGIDLKIEFSYRSFPQILPHLHAGTHFGLCPMLNDWHAEIPGVKIFPLRLMKDYKRDVVIIWNKKLRRPWLDIEAIAEILAWG